MIALLGDLGSGKTELVKGLAEGLGVTVQVHSPTFVLHHRYPARLPLEHYDLYRLEGMSWVDTGLDEPAADAVAVIEWAERAAPLEEWATIQIQLEVKGEEGRLISLRKGPDRVARCFREARD